MVWKGSKLILITALLNCGLPLNKQYVHEKHHHLKSDSVKERETNSLNFRHERKAGMASLDLQKQQQSKENMEEKKGATRIRDEDDDSGTERVNLEEVLIAWQHKKEVHIQTCSRIYTQLFMVQKRGNRSCSLWAAQSQISQKSCDLTTHYFQNQTLHGVWSGWRINRTNRSQRSERKQFSRKRHPLLYFRPPVVYMCRDNQKKYLTQIAFFELLNFKDPWWSGGYIVEIRQTKAFSSYQNWYQD